MNNDLNNIVYSAGERDFRISCTGLRPKTIHKFYVEDVDMTASCKPYNGDVGDDLVTDEYGKLNFTYYHNAAIPSGTTYSDYINYIKQITLAASIKKVEIKSLDNNSRCDLVIGFNAYQSQVSSPQFDYDVSQRDDIENNTLALT